MTFRALMIAVISASAALSACQTPATEPTEPEITNVAASDDSSDDCLRPLRISGFARVDDRHVLVSAATKSNQFLIETRSNCRDLEWADKLAIRSTSSLSCVDKFSKIYATSFSDRNTPGLGCFVKSVERVESLEDAKSIAQKREEARIVADAKKSDKK